MKRTIYTLIATALLLSCSGQEVRNSIKDLDDVESYIQERPDSALVVLQSINNEALSSKNSRHDTGCCCRWLLTKISLTSHQTV